MFRGWFLRGRSGSSLFPGGSVGLGRNRPYLPRGKAVFWTRLTATQWVDPTPLALCGGQVLTPGPTCLVGWSNFKDLPWIHLPSGPACPALEQRRCVCVQCSAFLILLLVCMQDCAGEHKNGGVSVGLCGIPVS